MVPAVQSSKKIIIRDIEIKNKLTITRGEVGRGNRVGRVSGTCIKDTLTKPKWGRIKGGKWGWLRLGGSGGRKMKTPILERQ